MSVKGYLNFYQELKILIAPYSFNLLQLQSYLICAKEYGLLGPNPVLTGPQLENFESYLNVGFAGLLNQSEKSRFQLKSEVFSSIQKVYFSSQCDEF